MFACYRKDEAHEPEVYCAAVASVLGDGYSRAIVDYVTDPRTGIPSSKTFLPSVAEVRDALTARAAHVDRLDRYSKLTPVPPKAVEQRAGQIDYGQFVKNCERDKGQPRPVGRFELNGFEPGKRGGSTEAEKQKTLELIDRANKIFYARLCAQEGIKREG